MTKKLTKVYLTYVLNYGFGFIVIVSTFNFKCAVFYSLCSCLVLSLFKFFKMFTFAVWVLCDFLPMTSCLVLDFMPCHVKVLVVFWVFLISL